MMKLDIVDRLRGKVRVPVNDGAGLLDGKDFFERSFPTSKAAMEAADEIERLRNALESAQASFEVIRLILIKNLTEPERGAFWKAVQARDAIRSLLTSGIR